ncbi:MAG TPA: BTAD domain-containing putative transcriptional regulator [Streptosporangiaceae bacterium]|nr:BTAD domain-containing putative transcriptional regulator [Streptosporangiaceae bacterium]
MAAPAQSIRIAGSSPTTHASCPGGTLRAGDTPGALIAYGRLRTRLWDELGVPPSPQTRELVSVVRARQAGATQKLAPHP